MPEMEYDDEDELMIILDDAEMQKSGRNEAEPELEALKSRSQSRERPGSRGSQTSQSSRCKGKNQTQWDAELCIWHVFDVVYNWALC